MPKEGKCDAGKVPGKSARRVAAASLACCMCTPSLPLNFYVGITSKDLPKCSWIFSSLEVDREYLCMTFIARWSPARVNQRCFWRQRAQWRSFWYTIIKGSAYKYSAMMLAFSASLYTLHVANRLHEHFGRARSGLGSHAVNLSPSRPYFGLSSPRNQPQARLRSRV